MPSLQQRRIGLLFAFFLAMLTLAALRSLQLGVLSGDRLAQAATSQQTAKLNVPARRGTIVDRNGVELAVADPVDDISATPYLIKDARRVAEKLAPLLEQSVGDLIRKLTTPDTGFVYLAKQVPATTAEQIRKLGIEGIDTTPGSKRVFPKGMMASQVLGGVNAEGEGYAGLELEYESALHGTDGTRMRTRDGVGEAVRVRDVVKARDGRTVQTTIDAAIQEKVEEVLAGVGKTYRPKGATVVVMDPTTSEVLALANWPRVDANAPDEAPAYAKQNRATGYTYEPGSTFKSVTVAGALEEGTVTPETPFTLPPTLQVADREIGESHDRGTVTLTTAGILAQSSNVGAVKIGQAMGKEKFDTWIRRFGFGRPTGVDLPGEEQGILIDLDSYSGSSMGNLPIGQGLAVTPMQMAQAYAAIANGGVLRSPRLVRTVGGRPVARKAGTRIISRGTSRQLRTMLEGVLAAGGTASEVKIPGYKLAGKTGTAQKVDSKGYSDTDYVMSFTGFAPADRPKLLISVMVDQPVGGDALSGGIVAAPAFGRIASFALPYLAIPPSG